jgi:hypothetical protein
MRFKIDRLCELAGITHRSSQSNLLRENKEETDETLNYDEDMHADEADESMYKDEADEMMHYEEDMHADEAENELMDVDETMLVQELRRARRIMQEGKRKAMRRSKIKSEKLQEVQLKAIIDQEVKNVLKDLNLNSGWIYGKNKPTQSRHGFSHQGSFLKGIGFK